MIGEVFVSSFLISVFLAIHFDSERCGRIYLYTHMSSTSDGILPGVHVIGLPGHRLRRQPTALHRALLPITPTIVMMA